VRETGALARAGGGSCSFQERKGCWPRRIPPIFPSGEGIPLHGRPSQGLQKRKKKPACGDQIGVPNHHKRGRDECIIQRNPRSGKSKEPSAEDHDNRKSSLNKNREKRVWFKREESRQVVLRGEGKNSMDDRADVIKKKDVVGGGHPEGKRGGQRPG